MSLVVVLAIGVMMIVFSIAAELPAKTRGADAVLDSFRPFYDSKALAQRNQDLGTLKAMANELKENTLPALAQASNVSPEQLQGVLESSSPTVAMGIADLAPLVGTQSLLAKGLELTGKNFRLSDQVPTKFLPATAVHFIFLIAGLMLFAIGAIGLVFPGTSRPMLWLAFLSGATFPVVALVLSFPVKTQAVDELTGAFRPLLTPPVATVLRGQLDSVQAMSSELVPALAQAANMPPGQLQGVLASSSPAVAKGLSELDRIMPSLEAITVAVETNVDQPAAQGGRLGNFRRADFLPIESQPTTTMHWLFVYPGLLLALVGAIGLIVPWWQGARAPSVSRELSGLATA